ncbi:hypothetical protein LB465_02840 [Salegentibacter sp. LM13S]|uniref:hypothetical protein n=1 Tax=Salegentibacter lacus TaxID=2873599 RepID=UPI001CCCEC5D|nr:hypothetical protein [Salegentibacter lacus]MBZ9629702.1 hypothetical protein [Salegentibacter lacus]
MKVKSAFQIISYLQYPLMLLALFFVIKPYLNGLDNFKNNLDILFLNYNKALIFLGLAISFSTLQDTTKTQNNFSKKIWINPKKGKVMILLLTLITFSTLALGIFLYFFVSNNKLNELSFGVIVLGIGLIGFLKTAIEVFENHRIDKKTNANNI